MYGYSHYNRHGSNDRPRRRRRSQPANVSRLDAMNATAAVIDAHGWVSRGKANETGEPATADRVKPVLKGTDSIALNSAHKVTATKALVWAGRQTGSEYSMKIAALANGPSMITARDLGLLCSIVGCYLISLARDAERTATRAAAVKANPNASHVGTIGERQVFTLTLNAIRQTRNGWTVHDLSDADGNKVTFFSDGDRGYNIGATYQLRATVKRHGEWDGLPVTTVNRPHVVSETPPA